MLDKGTFIRIVVTVFLLSFLGLTVNAQRGNTAWERYRHEGSVGYGLNTFLANIGEDDRIGTRFLLQRSSFNASYRYYIFKHVALRGSFTHAYSRKNDKDFVDSTETELRLDYEVTISELAAMVEYHIFDEVNMASGRSGKVRRARGGMSRGVKTGISIFAGIAVDYMRPFAEYYGDKMILRPYDPNAGFAPPSDYKRVNIHVPIGAQFRFVLSENWRIGFEACYRLGFRDYIDNVSSVYYVGENPLAYNSPYTDTQFTGRYVTLSGDNAPVDELAGQSGRSSYFIGMLTLSYRLKSDKKKK